MANIIYDYCIGSNNFSLRRQITIMLNQAGFYSSGEARNVPLLLRKLRSVQPWLAVIDTALPPGNISHLAAIIENDALAAAIYINTTGTEQAGYVQLDWPVEAQVLSAVAEAVCSEFARKKMLHKKIDSLQQKLNERIAVEKAKGIIAKHYFLSEEEAYNYLRKCSMERRITLAEMAARINAKPGSFSALGPPPKNP